MVEGDFTKVTDARGNMIGRRVVSVLGNEYIVGKKLGAGGVAKVFHASKEGDKKEYVFKEYVPKPGLQFIHQTIKRNIIKLIQQPLKTATGDYIPHFVRPLDIVDLPKSGGFGYIMDKVDTEKYKNLEKVINHYEYYPDAKALCKFCNDFADFYKFIHLKGWCYKDINEGNIYIDSSTGDFYIIDCDNISVPRNKTILGTAGYMAPEVYKTQTPDTQSDYFSIAVYFFRLLIGSYPMDGPGCERYMEKEEKSVDEAAPIIYGTNALFAFHPTDKSNAVYAELSNENYNIQTRKWNALPIQIKKCMMQTFVTALPYDKRAQRTTDVQWMHCFEDLEKNHIVQCKKCKNHNFDNRKTCYCCGTKLPAPKPAPVKAAAATVAKTTATASKSTPTPTPTSTPTRTTAAVSTMKNATPVYEVVFECLRMINGKAEHSQIAFELNERVAGNRLHPDFSGATIMYAKKNKDKNNNDIYTIYNCGPLTWELSREGKTAQQPPNAEVRINSNLVIKVDPTKCLLKVLGIREKK